MADIENQRLAPYRRLNPDESPMIMNRHHFQPQSSNSQSISNSSPTATPTEHYVRKKNVFKYTSALRTLIPFRRKTSHKAELPLDNVGYFSLATFNWMFSFLRNPLSSDSLSTAKLDSSNLNGQRLKDFLRDENVKRGKLNARMMCLTWQFVKTRIVVSSLIYIFSYITYIIGLVFFLTWFLQTDGIQNVLMIVLMLSVSLFMKFWSDSITFRTANRLQSAFMSLMYKHLLRVSILYSVSAHQIVTAITADSQKVHEAVMVLPLVLTVPLVLLLPIPMLLMKTDCYTWEDSIFAVFVCLLTTPILYLLARLSNVWKSHMTAFTSKRLISLQELLQHISLVKMTSKEKLFHRNAEGLRMKECVYMKKINMCDGFTVSFLHTVPLMVIVLLWHQNDTRIETIKCQNANLISIIILLLIPFKELLFSFWHGMIKVFEGLMAFKRLKRILILESAMKGTPGKPINHLIALSVSEATYVIKLPNSRGEVIKHSKRCACCNKFEGDEVEMQSKIVLQDINFTIPKGKIIGVSGDIHSGKTALILAILGQINPGFGGDKLLKDGSYAYVGQNPWIMDATLRENILFNEVFNHKRYYHVIQCCSLNDDIGQLSGGDQTLISDATLTLGQKQRIALARALYANRQVLINFSLMNFSFLVCIHFLIIIFYKLCMYLCEFLYRDIYLLDDLLSAVSADLGTIILERAIQNHLKRKTVIITSRQLKFLKLCDEIFVLKNGKIIEHGSHEILMKKEHYPVLIYSYIQEESNRVFENYNIKKASFEFGAVHDNSRQIPLAESNVQIPDSMEDEIDQESVDLGVRYNNSVSFFKTLALETKSSVLLLTTLIFRIICALTVMISPILILKYLKLDSSRYFVAMIFFFLILISRIVEVISYGKVTQKISLCIHQQWIEIICKSCLNILQCVSHSEILRWFSLHISEIDTNLPSSSILLVENLFVLGYLVVMLSICSCWFLIPVIVVCLFCYLLLHFANSAIMKFYIHAEDACLILNSFISSTIMGRVTIQAFGKEQDYWSLFHNLCDSYLAYLQLFQAASLWLSFWTRILSLSFITIILITIYIMEDKKSWLYVSHSENDYESVTSISIFCIFLLDYILNNILQTSASISSKFVVLGNHDAVVRSIKPEEESSVPLVNLNSLTKGSIVFRSAKLDFWSDFQPSWSGLSFHISSGEKIGVLGLPGSGKTSIVGALYKLGNLSQGSVSIGNIDIKTVPADYVRSCIALVPKNPIMFSGTLRMNIDPMHRYSLQELRESLEKVGMLEIIKDMPYYLETQAYYIEEKLTIYQRQLLYVAQAVLRDPKVIILEEPIEPVDIKNMFQVQDILEEVFHCTVLIVANSAKYISKCDKVIFVRDGQVAEFDSPADLFKNQKFFLPQTLTASTQNLLETDV